MNIVVCIKQTFDTEATIALDEDGKIDCHNIQFILNPYDEYALEEGLRLKERWGGNVTVISASAQDTRKTLQQCLAMGADDAVMIYDTALEAADAHVVAVALSRYLNEIRYDLILCGREAVDDGAAEVPPRLAEMLDLPQVTGVSLLAVGENHIQATREIDGGRQTVTVPLPCLISVQKGINEPRYPSMRNILQAKRKNIRTLSLSDLSFTATDLQPLSTVSEITLPAKRNGGEVFTGPLEEGVDKLIEIIKEKTKACRSS
jgi:electron transfer flavoprotein beta subunit